MYHMSKTIGSTQTIDEAHNKANKETQRYMHGYTAAQGERQNERGGWAE
jgi:hypothetical protein